MAKGGTKGGGARTCPLCAETLRADATKCKHCGSTLVGKASSASEPAAREAAAGPWPEPGPDDVGLAGPGAVAGALAGFGVGAWSGTGPGVLLALIGAAVGFGLGWSRDPRRAKGLLPAWLHDEAV